MALSSTLLLVVTKGANILQVFGDSLIIIKLLKEFTMRNFILQLVLEEILDLFCDFDQISFYHVYK